MRSNLKNYDNTVNYLYSLQRHGIKLGLTNTKKLMSILGEPQKSFHSIHIAGTNGKGSTATTIASILTESGFKVGLYTSPHLVSFTERIRINNHPITESDVIGLASDIRKSITKTKIRPTFFEFVTAMAFYYFACKNIDWAVVETGMGGRFDATNVILPDISVITNISLDHGEFLGRSISDIAFEKAGIIKPGVPVVTASGSPEVIKQLSDIAGSSASEIHVYGKDFRGSLISMDDKHITFDFNGYRSYKNLLIPLSGKHQLYNASLAIRVCEILIREGVSISDISISSGLLNVNLEGRLEWVSQRPPIILDTAHNPEAANTLTDSIKDIFPDKRIILVIGIMNDKDIGGILKPLIQIAESIILTKPKGERAAPPEKLRENIINMQQAGISYSHASIAVTNTVADAISLAKAQWQKERIILVTGSFYTTGEVKELLGHTGVLSHLRE